MRLPEGRSPALVRLAACLGLAAAAVVGCQDSKSVTGLSNAVPASVTIAGTWNGSFSAYDRSCGNSSASATFQQTGSSVTGMLRTSGCGVAGYFAGTLQGNMLLGSIKMQGCTGGGVSGTVSASELSLSIGDLTKPLVTDKVVMAGGAVTLRR